ncbi:MAG TPA: aspartate aminotransferase [Armatimonadetes bacterium]|nr:aspartate aminotransferase [Armatimonadota bacterium]
MFFAERMQRLGTESAFEVLARARELEAQGKHIIHLEIGEPDFDTPAHVRQAAVKAIESGFTHYEPPAGNREFRAAMAAHVTRSRRVEYSADEIVIYPGGKPGIFLGIVALVEPGDEVICPNPGYPIYESVANFAGATPVPIVLREENQWRLDVQELIGLISDRTRLVVLNSPQNPTGGVLTQEDLEAIAAVCIEKDIMVMSDETYETIIYDGQFHSIAAVEGMKERTLIVDCFSKSFAMTGWRLGFSASSGEVAEALTKLMINVNSCTASFTQQAGIAALQGPRDETANMVEVFRQRRDLVIEGLNQIKGISCLKPHGAFYAFPNITGTGYSSNELARKLLDEAGVAVLSGTAFGAHGEGYLRISYAASQDSLREALRRIGGLLG